MKAISHITIGVADLRQALELWVDRFGLELLADRRGPDPGLGQIWHLEPEAVVAQALVGTPGVAAGRIHFVQFAGQAASVRQGAAAADLCPKSLDVTCVDMPRRMAELIAAGFGFRSELAEYELEELQIREVQMPAHDDTNVVFIEVLGEELPLSPKRYGAVTSFVSIVPDVEAEARFYQDILRLDLLIEHLLAGPGIEATVGLPKGAALDLRLLGCDEERYGRVELIEYRGATGANRYPLARPPALGALFESFVVDSLGTLVERCERAGIDVEYHLSAHTLCGRGALGVIHTPAGLRVEIWQRGGGN